MYCLEHEHAGALALIFRKNSDEQGLKGVILLQSPEDTQESKREQFSIGLFHSLRQGRDAESESYRLILTVHTDNREIRVKDSSPEGAKSDIVNLIVVSTIWLKNGFSWMIVHEKWVFRVAFHSIFIEILLCI